jgi:hypothetical protein
MNFETPLSGGLLIVGSLFWDEHETRISLRETILNMDEAAIVPAPIRYGRKSEKRQTFTMVVSPACKVKDKMGAGILLPFIDALQNSIALNQVAESIITAEHKEKVSFARFNWGWGCLALLPNPHKADKQNIKQLAEFWSTKFSNGFEPSNYVVADEEPLVTMQGQLLLDWKDEYGDLDFVVLTATKPTLPIPTPIILSESIKINDSYFIGNRNNNIQTYQDEDILNLLNAAHEEKR